MGRGGKLLCLPFMLRLNVAHTDISGDSHCKCHIVALPNVYTWLVGVNLLCFCVSALEEDLQGGRL